ncbi:cadherin domain-containing protein [Romeria aff. gracilis LEGE 07310]|uniref:Cadherin domain-containing protein n=1 Tax=Vasconcelosia minhoensis LEGE 07310 TaxID=915328 RepID=A0A8J7A7D6_9CYAN|nr:Ig-like domain-containing protein [Romeria gracilis]MBE9078257.1 cadherin domain-containing protein [Romeria aff. gracilis LEGE 07310]
MGKPEDLLNINSKNVFAQPLLQDASLLNEVASLGIEVSTRSGKVKKSSLDPIAKAGTDDLSLQPLPTKPATPLNSSPTVFGSIPDGSTVKTSAADVDPVTGNPGLTPLANAIQAAPPAAIPVTLPAFAVMAEGTVTVNGSSDFDGDPRNLKDDALIYGGAGFTINGNPTLPIQRDANGNPILDAKGKPQLVKEAVAVAPDYRVSNASGNHYAGLIPPSVVPKQVVSVTAYADIRQHELTRRIPLGTPTVFFNAQQNPINNANDWAKKFPTPGTAANPTVVQVTNGGLTIPSGVNLSHTIITVANGDINFNGSGQTLNNTVLVTNNGNVNLAKVRSTDLSVLAAGAINMNGGAKFGGSTLLANETGGITFNGSTSTTDSGSNLAVISQGNITYNGSSNTRGIFLSAKDFTYNGSSTLYGAIGAKGNVLFNGRATVIADATISFRPTPPAITAGLTRDTAPGNTTNTDRITYDPTIAGAISVTNPGIQIGASGTIPANGSSTSGNQIIEFKARFDSMPSGSYRNILSSLQANGTFNLSRTELNQIYGSSLTDGPHSLHLLARDQYNNVTNVDIVFTLDTRTAAPILTLQPTSDSGQSNQDRITNVVGPTIRGTAEAGASLEIFNGNQSIGQTTVAADGTWQFTTPQLDNGVHTLSAIATDIAGNTNTSTTFQITVDSVLPQVSLTPPIDQAPLRANARLTGVTDGTGSAIVALRYHFNDRAEIDLAVSANGSFDQAIDFTGIGNGSHTLTVMATDIAGNTATLQFQVTVDLDTTGPVIAAELANDTAPDGTNRDRVTSDPTVSGTLADASQVVEFQARFAGLGSATDVLTDRQADGSFTFNRDRLEQIYGGALTDGQYSLQLEARDQYGNVSQLFELSFVLDTTLALSIALDPAFDSAPVGDSHTTTATVSLSGLTEAGATVQLLETGATVTADSSGQFSFSNVALVLGENRFTVEAIDVAGNRSTSPLSITRLATNRAPTDIFLSQNWVAENSLSGTVIGQLTTLDPDAADTHTYTLLDNAGGRFQLVGHQVRIAPGAVLDFESSPSYSIQVRTTDSGSPGLFFDKTLTIDLTDVNEAPRFTSSPVLNAEVGTPYRYAISTVDPERNQRTIAAKDLPSWLTLVDNGDGTATLNGSPTTAQSGLYPIQLTATDAGGLQATQTYLLGVDVILREGANFSPTQAVTFKVDRPSILSFTFDPTFDLTDLSAINDAFEVALVDAGGRSLVHTIAQGRDAFFNLTEGEPTALAVGATYSTQSRTVTLNLTGIPTHTAATLVFRLVNDDGDITTSVRVRDITLSDAPLGMQPQTGTVPGTARIPAPITPDKLSVLEDISSSIQADYRRTTFNAQTKLLYADVAVTNSGTYSVDAPLLVAISNISDPSVLVRDPDGFTPTRLPYYNFSALVADGKLDPAELTSTRALIFYNPNQVQFTYDLVVLAQLNQGPTIQTLPVREVLGGQPYLYDVNATDPNGDVLTYQLLSAPQGMAIDAQSGVISWDTATSDRGSHAVLIQVSDNRGGITKQSFTLSVTEELPNRPPIFTSTPAVDAFIGQRYAYDADAVDPDQDNPLTYDLISGPDGMTVDPSTGLVYWTPPPALILGDTVLGRINVPGEIDEFTFSGAIGQRLYFDPLQYSGSHYDWRMNVYSPSGIKVIDAANFAWDQNKLITLTEDGTYRTVVRTVGDKVGSYGFSVINLSLVPVVPFDVVVKGQLSPGSEDDVFRFTGNRGQKLFFDQLSKSGDFDWVLYDANNQVVQSSYYFSDMEVNLPSNGEYVLTLRGRSGFSSTADYAFSIVTPDLITTPITLGNVVSGTIGEKGEQDIYTFTGSIGQRLFLDVLTYSGSYYSQRLYLYSPSGVTYLNRYLTYGDEGPFTLTEAGTYRLVIDASGEDTGSYSFNLLDVGQATPISLDVSQSGQLSPGQETHLYTFTGNTGQILFFDSMMNSSGSWTLYDSGNQRVDGTSLRSDFEVNLSQSGTYTLVLQGDQNKAINYQFQIITPEISTTELTLGSTVSGTISEKGEQDIYTFTGSVGQRLYLDVLTYSSSYSQNLYLYSPSGVVYLSRSLGSGDTNPFTLKEDGTYRLVVDGAGENTGSYSFSLLDVEQATPVELDVSQSGQLSPGQETHLYTFTGNAGQRLYFDSMMNSSGSWALYNSGNQQVEGTNLNSDFEVILSQTDTYTLVLQGNRNSPIDYQFQIITPETTTADLILGNSISGTIAEKGEQDVYTFTGSIGQRLFLDVLAYSGNHVQKLYLYSPSGVIYLDRSLSSGDAAPFTLTEAGIYRLVIDGAGESTGSYSFNLLDVGQATPISLDVSQSGQLSPGQETHLYTFEGNARQRLFFDSMMNSSGSWTLYNSGNQRVDGTSLNSDFEVTLSQLDTYTLVLQGNRSEAIDYQFQVITPTVNTVELTLGNTVSGAIGEKGEQDIYTFIGNVGQQLFLDVLTYSGSYAQSLFLYSPSGVVQLNRYLSSGDSVPFTLTESGTYRLVVDGVGENTGSYSFRMADLAAASDLALDTPTNDDLLPQAVRFYQLKGTPGQRLQFDSLSAVPGADWVIYGPGNFVLGSAPLSNDFEVELISVGTHFLAVRNSSNNAVSYSIQVNTLPSLSVENTGLGIIHSGVSASTPTSKSFTAAAGTLIYFDGQGTSSGVYARLSDPKGDQIFNINAYRDSGSILLRQSGAYTLQLTGNGSYQYRVIDLGTAKDLVLNTVTNVTLSPITATTAYKFTGTFGQQLYYDALNSNYPNVSVRLVTPSGRELFNSSAQDDQNLYQTLTLDEAGTFYLLFSGSQSAASSVSFRLFDKAQVQSITLDQEVTGRFTNSRQSDLYRFAANAGQYMYVNQQAGGSPNQWYLFGPGGLKLSNNTYYNSNYIYTDQEFTLSADGEYLLVMRGNGSSNLDYKFTLVTPEFVTQELPLNQTVSGTLSEPGENDIYTFTGAVGQQLFFDALNSNSPGFTVRVYSPTNQQVYSSAIQNDFHLGHTFTLAESGNYRLIIDGDGDAIGNYSFRLLNKAEAQLIALDQEVIGRFANSRQSDLYRFMGNAGQYLYVNQQAGNYPNEWYLFGPGGLKVLSTYIYNDKEFTLPADGEYLLVMRGNGSSNQDYKFTLVTPEFVTQALPLNQTVNGTLSKPGENDIYTFSGTVGQQLFFDALNSSSPGFTVRVSARINKDCLIEKNGRAYVNRVKLLRKASTKNWGF